MTIIQTKMKFKKEMRVIGIDDSPFNKFKDKEVLVIGVIMRGGLWVDGTVSSQVKVDGNDATNVIADMINKCRFKPQLQCIFLNGIAVAGFNVVDIKELNKKTKISVIVVIRSSPNIENIKKTLIKIKQRKKIKLIEKAGRVMKIGKIFVQLAGIDLEKAEKILKIACTRSLIPEPLRLAHIIAAGIVAGESKGRA